MSQIEIFIDPNSPAHGELESGIRQSFNALASISFREEKRPVPPGTLSAGLDQAVAFVVQHPDKIVILATAALNLINNLLRFRSTKGQEGDKPSKPIVLSAKGEVLSLPASEAAQKRFLSRVEGTAVKPPRSKKGAGGSKRSKPHRRAAAERKNIRKKRK